MEKLKTGDVVFLKSGSMSMSINEIKGNNCKCVWMDESLTILYTAVLHKDALTKDSEDLAKPARKK